MRSKSSPRLGSPFVGTFVAGFECSTHRRYDNVRLDMVDASQHFDYCDYDYALAARHGMRTARDGLRWHLIEAAGRGRYDWSSLTPMLDAARRQDMRVIWDLCHYGYPDWLDLWSDEFIPAFAAFAREAVLLIEERTGRPAAVCPVNEISFWAWLGGKEGKIAPFAIERAPELKRLLVRVWLAAVQSVREAAPDTLFISAEPLINVVRDTNDEADILAAATYHEAQFEATDILLGLKEKELGGSADAIDVIGINFYPHNQWRLRGGYVPLGHHDYTPLSELLLALYARYRKPVFIAETGAEHSARAPWLSYVCQEVRAAREHGVPVLGICLYPVAAHRGWDNDRICQVGVFGNMGPDGTRSVEPLVAMEMARQQSIFDAGVSGRPVAPVKSVARQR